MSKNCIDLHTPHLKSKFNKLIKSGVKEKDAELEIALEEAKRIFNSLNNLKTKLGLKLSEEDEITNAIVTTKAEDFQDLSETFDLEGELKTNIAALEKIIKDAESEDAPATVKQELIEKGNAKLAEMKAELAVMQQSKNETNSTDDKKADIERRRQEELLIPQSLDKLPDYLAEGIKKSVEQLPINQRYEIVKQAILGKTAQQIVSELNLIDTDGRRNTEIVRQVRAYYGIPSQDTEGYQEWKNKVDKINAKYDAELKTLEEASTTKSEIEAKKADIERRRQEELFGNITALEFETTDTKGRLRKTTIKTKVDENGFKYSFETTVDGKSSSTSAPKVSKDQIKNSSIYENLDQNSKDFIDELPDDAVIFLQSIAISNDKNSAAGLGNGNITIGYASKSEGGRVDDIALKYQPNKINAKYDAELATLKTPKEKLQENINDLNIVQDISFKAQEIKNKAQSKLDELNKTEENKQETPIEKLRRLAKEKIEESKLQSTSEFTYRGGTYTLDYNRNLLSPIPKTATAQKNLIDSIGKQDIYDVTNSTINSKDVYLVFNKNLNKFVVLDKNLNSIPLDESVVTSKAYQDAQNRCK